MIDLGSIFMSSRLGVFECTTASRAGIPHLHSIAPTKVKDGRVGRALVELWLWPTTAASRAEDHRPRGVRPGRDPPFTMEANHSWAASASASAPTSTADAIAECKSLAARLEKDPTNYRLEVHKRPIAQ